MVDIIYDGSLNGVLCTFRTIRMCLMQLLLSEPTSLAVGTLRLSQPLAGAWLAWYNALLLDGVSPHSATLD